MKSKQAVSISNVKESKIDTIYIRCMRFSKVTTNNHTNVIFAAIGTLLLWLKTNEK